MHIAATILQKTPVWYPCLVRKFLTFLQCLHDFVKFGT